ncbi:MAG: dephospho-CoA kinase [Chloroflexi bacterium]|nr:dephospho-CoA kinase [Chloroflexota bacterium]
MPDKTIIGLTGNIGVGKSTVLHMLARRGAHIIDADKVAHQVMAPGGRAYDAIVSAFGERILNEKGEIDRSILGDMVFSDQNKLAQLERIVHPAVYAAILDEIERADADIVVIEAIKLLESGMTLGLCDQVWVVTAPVETQIQRLMQDRNMSREEAERRMAMQSPQTFKVSQADVVIDNSGTLDELEAQVEAAWRKK